MRDVLAPGGIIYKISADGKDWEVWCSGFRNTYDAAFDKSGELFTYDADMEYDFNTPWYRPTRICHCVSGAEFGWRNGAGKRAEWYPDNLPPVLNVGPGSPTGMIFGYGAKFPAKYQNALFCLDWSWGRLYAVHLQPQGATFTATKEDFLNGSPLPMTDVVINPGDGAMYFTIGGRKVQSGLYRVTYTGSESTAPAPAPTTGETARDERHRIEAYHHEDTGAVRDLHQRGRRVVLGELAVVVGVEGDRCILAFREQGVAARRAEVDALGVSMPAVVTEHGNHGTPRHASFPRPGGQGLTWAQPAVRSR